MKDEGVSDPEPEGAPVGSGPDGGHHHDDRDDRGGGNRGGGDRGPRGGGGAAAADAVATAVAEIAAEAFDLAIIYSL